MRARLVYVYVNVNLGLLTVGRVARVHQAHHRGEDVLAGLRLARSRFRHHAGDDGWGQPNALAARLRTGKLHIARTLERPEAQIRLGDVRAPRQQAVVAKDHHVLVGKVTHDALTLAEIDRDALQVVIGNAAM